MADSLVDDLTPPTLDAYSTGSQLAVWCEHERMWHWHGRCGGQPSEVCRTAGTHRRGTCTCPPGNGDGHRVAHCYCPRATHRKLGYRLREVGPFTSEVERSKKVARSNARCTGPECVQYRAEEKERAWRYPYGEDVLGVTCPRCAAAVGTECAISRGHVHAARVNVLLAR